MNAGHKVNKEWVDLKASENARRSIKEFGSVGWTKENVGKGKRIITVDCITENGLVPGALWIFSEDGQKKKVKKQEKLFEESAVNAEKARGNENTVLEKNTDQPENLVSSSTLASTSSKKRKSKDESLSSASKRAKTETDIR